MAYPRPSVQVVAGAAPSPAGSPTDTATWFVVGSAEKGPVDRAVEILSMNDYIRYFGARQVGSVIYALYDAAETYFREGGTRMRVARASGPSAAKASRTLLDSSSGNSLTVTAKTPGIWGNSLSVAVVAGTAGNFILVITHSTLGEVARSDQLADQATATTWENEWVTVTIPGGAGTLDPAVAAAAALTGGADDNAGITDSVRQAALALFPRELGPGQVSIPGTFSSGNRAALLTHAEANNRHALLDPSEAPTKSTLLTDAASLAGAGKEFYSFAGDTWVKIPNPAVLGTKRTVPPSAYVAALMARNDAVMSPNEPAAGFKDNKGVARYVIDIARTTPWTMAEIDELNSAGVNTIRAYRGKIVRWGARTLGDPRGEWVGEGNQRLRMRITAKGEIILEQFLQAQIDGQGNTLADVQGALRGMLLAEYAQGGLYGASSDEAFVVDVGPSINTPQTIANLELNADLALRMSPFAELVTLRLTKVAVSQNLPGV